ncbi:hypothetical protein ACKFKG_05625 [Phormidesmis sp. 146-35]
MSNLRDRPPSEPTRNSGNGLRGFLYGILFTALIGIGGAAYFFLNQRRPAATEVVTPPTAAVSPQPTTTAAPSPPAASVDSGSLPAAQTLNLQANHPNGSTLRLTQLTFAEDSITASIAITNGYKEAIKLNGSDDMLVSDSLGNQYNLAAPPENSEITIQPGTTLKGQFVFKGRIAPGNNTVTLTTNSKFGNDAAFSTSPKFVLSNIPIGDTAK